MVGQSGSRSALEHARNGSLGAVFDHIAIAVSDLAASERFYRTVLSVLGVELSHADAELVGVSVFTHLPAQSDIGAATVGCAIAGNHLTPSL